MSNKNLIDVKKVVDSSKELLIKLSESFTPKQKYTFAFACLTSGTGIMLMTSMNYEHTEEYTEVVENGVTTKTTKKSTTLFGSSIIKGKK